MSNYEIMILVNPNSSEEDFKSFLFSILKNENTKLEKLERTEIAYPIKKLSRANYYLINTKAEPTIISELTRKLNINKSILRSLVINLDSEKGLKPKKVRKSSRKLPFANKDGKKPFVKQTKDQGEKDSIKKEEK
ncbi:30S ribosomal protein S6 [Metamycoplasma equirhinis]|uniref:30S ribosomal protein S6 n=1 Tax=Metamycoplasma equirhinis TaxID=92402 RepID=UPI0035936779